MKIKTNVKAGPRIQIDAHLLKPIGIEKYLLKPIG
jgi:hypothetical protein